MRKTALIITAVTVLLMAAVAPQAGAQQEKKKPASIVDLTGAVQALLGQYDDWSAASKGDGLAEGEKIKTQKDSDAILKWLSGHAVRVYELSMVEVTRLASDFGAGRDRVRIHCNKGRLYVTAAKLSGSDSFFEIVTPSARAAVRGTKFFVEVTEDETTFTVIEGQIEVIMDEIQTMLTDNMTLNAIQGEAPGEPEQISEEKKNELKKEAAQAEKRAGIEDFDQAAAMEEAAEQSVEEVIDIIDQQEIIDNAAVDEFEHQY